MKNKAFSSILIILIVTFVVGLLTIFYFLGNQNSGIELTNVLNPPSTPTSTSDQDETADWQTYRDEEYGIEFKYPLDWSVGQSPNSKESLLIAPESIIKGLNEIEWATGGSITLGMTINKDVERPEIKSDEYSQLIKEDIIFVDNRATTEYTTLQTIDLPGVLEGSVIVSVVIQSGEVFYKIDFLDNQYRELFNQILSTFKFIKEETDNVACTMEAKLCPDGSYVGRTGPNCEFAPCPDAEDETANWKVYKDEYYGLEIKYPQDWESQTPLLGEKEGKAIVIIGNLGDSKTAISDLKKWIFYESDNVVNFKEEEILLDNFPAIKITYKVIHIESTGATRWEANVFFDKEKISKIWFQTDEENYLSVFDQILSTFKFLD